MEVMVYTLNAFATDPNGGNPAGVVLEADLLKQKDMQTIAHIVGFSETAFIQTSSIADFKIQFFTPNAEVDLCGHATIAAFYLMVCQQKISHGTYTLECKAGLLQVTVENDYHIFLSQALPTFYDQPDREDIIKSLHISAEDLDQRLPLEIVSTGLKDILVPIRSLEVLNKITPDFNQITLLSKKYQVIGFHLFTLDTKNEMIATCRNFAPLYDIPEESATGTSCGALTCYLYKHKIISDHTIHRLAFAQGHSMNQPSTIISRLSVKQGRITQIEVGGTASNIQKRSVTL
ncbi:PhzF family phenazine biosynthesis protein [Brevibacillus laterosporus]|nr:PhzF family phenazine biosynthesis protein [Brevibacillus laterosporus]MBG9798631.1 phenazine biosynthesis protein PhzF [Brevibacillus laterosporus]MED1909938.1 PhzF family phenazine biosynthesis protein [Brevibacillus laterosporus]